MPAAAQGLPALGARSLPHVGWRWGLPCAGEGGGRKGVVGVEENQGERGRGRGGDAGAEGGGFSQSPRPPQAPAGTEIHAQDVKEETGRPPPGRTAEPAARGGRCRASQETGRRVASPWAGPCSVPRNVDPAQGQQPRRELG